jgi:hypothetical protein
MKGVKRTHELGPLARYDRMIKTRNRRVDNGEPLHPKEQRQIDLDKLHKNKVS